MLSWKGAADQAPTAAATGWGIHRSDVSNRPAFIIFCMWLIRVYRPHSRSAKRNPAVWYASYSSCAPLRAVHSGRKLGRTRRILSQLMR